MGGLILDVRLLARALGGEVVGSQVVVPGPGHGPRDRSLSVKLSASSPDGFLTHSFAGDDFATCRDYVRERLGLNREPERRRAETPRPAVAPSKIDDGRRKALALWHEGDEPRGTLAERYLASRGLELGADVAGDVLRWHPRTDTMISLFRNVRTDAPQAVSRTFLDSEGRKLGRKFLGPVAGAAIKLDADAEVTIGLVVGEGIETTMSARQLGLGRCWALGSAGAIAAFPVLGGIECLTLLAEHDDVSARAVEICASRWHAAQRDVFIDRPIDGKDLNDALRKARHG
jgi:Toprim domain